MGGRNLSPLVNISENLGKAAALLAFPLITPLFRVHIINGLSTVPPLRSSLVRAVWIKAELEILFRIQILFHFHFTATVSLTQSMRTLELENHFLPLLTIEIFYFSS